jgi:hypothetical protein
VRHRLFPYVVAGLAHHAGEIFICDSRNHRVSVVAPHAADGLRPLRSFGGEGDAPGQFRKPWDVAVAHGRLVVSEYEGRRLQLLSLRGVPLQTLLFPSTAALSGLAAAQARPPSAPFSRMAHRLP